MIVDVDDLMDVDEDSPFKPEHDVTNASEVLRVVISIADLVTTTTPYLEKRLRKLNKNVTVLPNYPDLRRWDLPKSKNTSDTIRIGWAGSITHLKDLELIVNPLKRICKEFPQVRLLFIGESRIASRFEGLPVEYIPGVPFEVWPAKLHSLRLDIGLAPLLDNEFNRCKSRIKFYEYAIAEIPGIYSPTVYQERGFDGEFGMIAENEDQWYQSIKNYILFPELRQDVIRAAYAYVTRRCSLEKHIGLWEESYRNLTLT